MLKSQPKRHPYLPLSSTFSTSIALRLRRRLPLAQDPLQGDCGFLVQGGGVLRRFPEKVFLMGLSKIEVNLRRLLAAAPQQQNQAKLIHYVTTLREQLEQLGMETTAGVSSVTKAKLNEYSEKIESIAAKLAAPSPQPTEEVEEINQVENSPRAEKIANYLTSSEGLRRRTIAQTEVGGSTQESKERSSGEPIRLDVSTQAHIEKHRKLQEDLTDEMVGLAHQLKESSLMMNQSLQDTETADARDCYAKLTDTKEISKKE
ncbi:uncharacterized protein [Typha angustifolia]|uniref:uncharacterized protein isoform X2 n=1 Tax=Typha angustifolia TaxID=59011 RepID=UPI003C2BBCDC